MSKRALILLHPGFEEMEAVAPIDLLSRAGIEIIQASTSDALEVIGRSGIVLKTSHFLADVCNENFDAIILPGGPGILALRGNHIICSLLRRQHALGKLIGCICAAPLLLHDAGLIDSIQYSAHPSTIEELPNASTHAVVEAGCIITSRGAGTATEFALKLIERLTDEKTAKEIANAICWPKDC